MNISLRNIFAIFLATIFIVFWEFLRNELIFKSLWTDHYQSLGLIFPSAPVNGFVWVLWSVVMAIIIYMLLEKFSLMKTSLITWLSSFLMMWLVIGNLSVLPVKLLFFAVPLSMIEVYVAVLIINKVAYKS